MQELQSSLDDGHDKLRATQSYADRVIPNTSRDGAKKIRQHQDQNKDNYEKLKKALNGKKGELDTSSNQWAEADRVHEQMDSWMNDIEEKMAKFNKPGEAVDKKTELERTKVSSF